jgi:NTP pyrophosphatase (non-canonical NTP hydrolase)
MSDTADIIQQVIRFRDERDWEQFHNSKDLALAISIEASELNELFLWKTAEEVDVELLKDELADILAFAFLLANKYQLDIAEIISAKLKKNAKKYPINKSKGSPKKYDQL